MPNKSGQECENDENNTLFKPKDQKRLAPGSKAKIRNLLSVLYNHAIRWGFIDFNPISGPTKGSGVRQSSKRERVPDILELAHFSPYLLNAAPFQWRGC